MKELKDRIEFLLYGPRGISYAVRGLKYWACWKCYQDMINYVKEAKTHPGLGDEIARAPELLEIFVDHLENNAHRHINISTMTFFDESVIGERDLWREWQNYAIPLVRTPENYRRRLQVWKNLYNANNGNYEMVISLRNEMIYDNVPYWYLWNYGNVIFAQTGYPRYVGLHFIERAQMNLKLYIEKAVKYLERYAVYYLAGGKYKPAPFRDYSWIKSARLAGVL